MAATNVAAVQMPSNFDAAGQKLIKKVAELSIRLGGHALVAYTDVADILRYYVSDSLQELKSSDDFLGFLQQQLHSHSSSDFRAVDEVEGELQTVPVKRRKLWEGRMPNLQYLAEAIAATHPQRAFFVYMHTGPSSNDISTWTYSTETVQHMFSNEYWQQLCDWMLLDVPAQSFEASSSSMAASATAHTQRQRRQPSEQPHSAADTSRPKKRKLTAVVRELPGTLEWFRNALLISPFAY